jgi:hypothetical protein
VKILYIDESGVPEMSSLDHFCILTGVLIDEENESNFLFLMNRIKEKYRLSLTKNLHAVDIFENNQKDSYLGITRRRSRKDLRNNFQIEVWDLIKDYRVNYKAVCVPKDFIKRHLFKGRIDKGKSWLIKRGYHSRIDNQLPMDVGVNALYHWAIKKLKTGEKLKIVFESRNGDVFTVRNHNLVSDPNIFRDRHMVAFAKEMKKHVVSVAFANKEVVSAGLELCDIIGYTCNIYCMRCKKSVLVEERLKKCIVFKGIHKTLNSTHFQELSLAISKKYITGLVGRTKRIANHYFKIRNSLSPAKAGAQLKQV